VTTPAAESVLIQPRGPGASRLTFANDPGMSQAVRQVATALGRLRSSAASIHAAGLVSADGRSALVTFDVPGPRSERDARVRADLAAVAKIQAAHPDLLIAEAGGASASAAGNALLESDFRRAEYSAIPITLILLLVVFGALIAAGIPVIFAGSAVVATISLLAIPSRVLPIRSGTSEIVLILGMAVGVDYSLFYLRRAREERAAGRSPADALRIAAATSGRAIVISGLTVMISLAGLFFSGIELFTGMAFGTITVVGVAVAGSLTVLPALLSMLGDWAERGRIPVLGRYRTVAAPSRLWAALVRRVVRHPFVWGGTATLAMVLLTAPAFGMRLGNQLINLPSSVPVAQTLARIAAAFPGRPAPAEIVVSGRDLAGPAVRAALIGLETRTSPAGPIPRSP